MALSSDIFSALKNDSAIRSALGLPASPVNGEIVPIFPGQSRDSQASRFIVWQIIATSTDATQDDSATFEDCLVQFSCVAATYDAANTIGKAVMSAFNSLANLASGGKSIVEGQRDSYEPGVDSFVRIVEVRFLRNPTAS